MKVELANTVFRREEMVRIFPALHAPLGIASVGRGGDSEIHLDARAALRHAVAMNKPRRIVG